jgi:glycosyltransferase involved in cell wall biosynthesis
VSDVPLSILWLTDLQPRFGIRHGATLRWLNFSRELTNRGHQVFLSTNQDEPVDRVDKGALLEEYRIRGWLKGHVETHYRFPASRGRRAHLQAHPALVNASLRPFQDETAACVESIVAKQAIDVVIISQRKLLFLASRLRHVVPVIIDWMDSLVLTEWRSARAHFRAGAMREIPASLKRMVQAALQERFYGRRSSANMVVSPVDLRIFNQISGRPELSRLLLNGVETRAVQGDTIREPSRVIFTGAMDAPQNHEAALWFIDEILPAVLRARPETEFVVAGRDPGPELLRRAGRNVRILGEVPDLAEEIAKSALAVAPLRSGCGFKNKVVEAIAASTFVVGTRLASEFLPRSVREKLVISDTPQGLAAHVLSFLENPARFDRHLYDLTGIVAEEFSWTRRTSDLEEIIKEVIGGSATGTPR